MSFDLDEVKQLVGMLSYHRSFKPQQHMDIGQCLYNISDTLFNVWKGIATTNTDLNEQWSKMIYNNETGIITLHKWAAIDNMKQYMIYMKNKKSIDSNSCMADIFYMFESHKYKYTDQGWYKFKNHMWHIDDNEYDLLCSIEMYFKGFTDKYIKQLTNRQLLKRLQSKFYDKSFLSELNKDSQLIGFENGIYDLRNHIFRDGRPEDNVSFSVGYDYLPFDEKNTNINTIKKILSQIFIDQHECEYMYCLFASFLSGYNIHQKFYIWKSKGGAGISIVIQLLEKCLGQYAMRISCQNLNLPPDELKNKRLVTINEDKDIDKVMCPIKNWVSGDQIIFLNRKGDMVIDKPQAKLLYGCNTLPAWDMSIIMKYLDIVPFKSQFVSVPNTNDKYQLLKDEHLFEKIDHLKQAFMSILINEYPNYEKYGLLNPSVF